MRIPGLGGEVMKRLRSKIPNTNFPGRRDFIPGIRERNYLMLTRVG